MPADICVKYPEVAAQGLYRKLNDGKVEFISYCARGADGLPIVQHYTSFSDEELQAILDDLYGKQ